MHNVKKNKSNAKRKANTIYKYKVMHQKLHFWPSMFYLLACYLYFHFLCTALHILSLTKASQAPRNGNAFVERACDSIPVITIANQLDNWVGSIGSWASTLGIEHKWGLSEEERKYPLLYQVCHSSFIWPSTSSRVALGHNWHSNWSYSCLIG